MKRLTKRVKRGLQHIHKCAVGSAEILDSESESQLALDVYKALEWIDEQQHKYEKRHKKSRLLE